MENFHGAEALSALADSTARRYTAAMRQGQPSKTAELVCMGRALAHATMGVGGYEDPTALQLLSDEGRRRVERVRGGEVPNLRARFERMYLQTQAAVMVARTVAIDEAIRRARAPQLVLLGAGLDGRAWRMRELGATTVFEVDHPASQRDKRERARRLTPVSQDIRFVPVDFERDELEQALAAAGHAAERPSCWVWEGVVMYLSHADIESTLASVQRRSAPGSHLVVLYHSPALILAAVGLLLRRLGEPLRSSFQPAQLSALLSRYGFEVTSDRAVSSIGGALSPEVGRLTKRVKHLRVAVAELAAR
jgi:methyltransferase (TIGR00027 family)